MERTEHWNHIYATKAPHTLSWFEREPTTSLRLLDSAGMTSDSCVIDVGGGDSCLVDQLIERGLHSLFVLDVSPIALMRARTRLGEQQQTVTWIEADVTGNWEVPVVDIWHDRAVFHFLTDAGERANYVACVKTALRKGGTVVIATFAVEGPRTCSGLAVQRYSPQMLAAELGESFRLEETMAVHHQTPAGHDQPFVFCRFTHR